VCAGAKNTRLLACDRSAPYDGSRTEEGTPVETAQLSFDEYVTSLLLRAQNRAMSGQGLVEYALIIALVAIILINGLSNLRAGIGNTFTTITNNL
jgi:Flp pilus assembly pilin Flp